MRCRIRKSSQFEVGLCQWGIVGGWCECVLISKFSKEDTQELSVACRYPALSHFSLICGSGVTSPETEGRGECPAPIWCHPSQGAGDDDNESSWISKEMERWKSTMYFPNFTMTQLECTHGSNKNCILQKKYFISGRNCIFFLWQPQQDLWPRQWASFILSIECITLWTAMIVTINTFAQKQIRNYASGAFPCEQR